MDKNKVKAYNIQKVAVSGCILHLDIDGKSYEIDLARQSSRLARATQAQRQQIEISPSGCGLHWPAVDEDLSVDGLIGVRRANPLIAAEASRMPNNNRQRQGSAHLPHYGEFLTKLDMTEHRTTESVHRKIVRTKGITFLLFGALFPLLGVFIFVVSDRSDENILTAIFAVIFGLIFLCIGRFNLRFAKENPDFGKWSRQIK